MDPVGDRSSPKSPDALKLLTAIGSPIALATALLFYFGWVRSNAQARALGTDVSVFEMSAQDFALRSINVIFFPVLLLLLAWLLFLRLDPLARAHARAVAPFLRRAWMLVVVGLALTLVAPSFGSRILPLCFLLGIGGTAYGGLLARLARGDDSPIPLARVGVVVALMIVALFWQTERMASFLGEASIENIKADVARERPPVTLFSAGSLYLDPHGTTETIASDPNAAYRYRYDGLYFL